MRSPPPQNRRPTRAAAKTAEPKIARHLATTPHEFAVTRFEQGLICAAAAFYRFYGVLLGREGRVRNISGQDNGDGTVTIYAATSTVSGSGDVGADPNRIVAITDTVTATSPGNAQFTTIESPQNRTIYRGVAVVPANYGS